MTRNANMPNRTKGRRAMTEQERLMRERLDHFPLASTYDIADMCADEYKPCHDTLRSLENKGLVGGMDAGYSLRRQHRYWNNDRSAGRTSEDPQPKQPKLVHSLMQRITLMESVYFTIGLALADTPKRQLREFHWHFDRAVDATIRFNDGWTAFKWSGIWQSQKLLTEYLEHLDDNLRAWKPDRDQPSPGRICFVVPDAWQAELVRRVVAEVGLSKRCLIFNANTQQIEGDYDLSQSRRLAAATGPGPLEPDSRPLGSHHAPPDGERGRQGADPVSEHDRTMARRSQKRLERSHPHERQVRHDFAHDTGRNGPDTADGARRLHRR